MSFNPMMARYLGYLSNFLNPRDRVVELGNQTMNLDVATEKHFSVSGHWNGESAAIFYRYILSYADYKCIDTNSNHGAKQFDINEYSSHKPDWTASADWNADLVTNNGTGEHIFDQAAVFHLMHDLCRPEGLMIHVLPFLNWINHGFYSFHPLLFMDLAKVNGYGIIDLSIGNRWGTRYSLIECGIKDCIKQLKPRDQGTVLGKIIAKVAGDERIRTTAEYPNVMVCAALRKNTQESFRIPFQGKYVRDISDNTIKEEYAR